MTEEQTEEERRLTRLVADQGAQIARLTQTLRFNEMIIKELKHEVVEERAAVVAWLRRGAGLSGGEPAEEWSDLWVAARDIERGEHRREEE